MKQESLFIKQTAVYNHDLCRSAPSLPTASFSRGNNPGRNHQGGNNPGVNHPPFPHHSTSSSSCTSHPSYFYSSAQPPPCLLNAAKTVPPSSKPTTHTFTPSLTKDLGPLYTPSMSIKYVINWLEMLPAEIFTLLRGTYTIKVYAFTHMKTPFSFFWNLDIYSVSIQVSVCMYTEWMTTTFFEHLTLKLKCLSSLRSMF
jgi:hypothetical protein